MIPIGPCRYDKDSKRLENPQGEIWDLPRAEYLVLSTLLAHLGEPVKKRALRCGPFDEPQVSESAVVRAVFQLRHFLQDEEHCLIQTVKGVGYRLCLPSAEPAGAAPVDTPEASPTRRAPRRWERLALLGLAALALGLLVIHGPVRHWPSGESGPQLPSPVSIPLPGDEALALYWLSPASSHVLDLSQMQRKLTRLFSDCAASPWQEVYASLSSDQRVLNLTLYGQENHHTRLRNLKISDPRGNPNFLPPSWQQKELLCD
ncbi:transcriptional regulator [Ferrimonas balearica]|uniref:winged helix-turn-helix domain-containing protein n=1 Tax=Ferrimonas balearica TaxID=44012 RepID=UPI001C99FF78|nr:helix-turn-helix domain-containing protein [Ferrimonas balearica]MBY5993568.1 helix-turn-helix domain-containing protein [Ferrimonas balearica]